MDKTAEELIKELDLEEKLFKSHYYPVTPEAFDDSEVYDGTMQDYLLDLLSEKYGYSAELEQFAGRSRSARGPVDIWIQNNGGTHDRR